MWNSLVLVVASDSRFGYASLLVSSMEVGYGSAMTIVICSSYCLDVVTYKGRGFLDYLQHTPAVEHWPLLSRCSKRRMLVADLVFTISNLFANMVVLGFV